MHTSKPNSRFQDIAGQSFGNMVAVRLIGYNAHSKQLWEFRCLLCDSLTTKVANTILSAAKKGQKPSCGCQQFKGGRRTHGQHGTKEHRAWKAMRQRCNDPNTAAWKNYGGRGIKVCARWDDFAAFLGDVGPAPSPKHTLERKKNDRDYEPGNVVWATKATQVLNTRVNHLLTFRGRTQPVAAWAAELGLKQDTVFRRLYRGWSVEKTLTTPTA